MRRRNDSPIFTIGMLLIGVALLALVWVVI